MNKKIETSEKEIYVTPDIEVVEIEIEQNILASGSGDVNSMDAVDW